MKAKANWGNAAGKRPGMHKGSAPHAPIPPVHNPSYDYAPLAKVNPRFTDTPKPGVGSKPIPNHFKKM